MLGVVLLAKTSIAKEAGDVHEERFLQPEGASCVLRNNKAAPWQCLECPLRGKGSVQSCSRNAAGEGVFVFRNTKHFKFKGAVCSLSCVCSSWAGQRRFCSLPLVSGVRSKECFGIQSHAAAGTCPQDPSLNTSSAEALPCSSLLQGDLPPAVGFAVTSHPCVMSLPSFPPASVLRVVKSRSRACQMCCHCCP